MNADPIRIHASACGDWSYLLRYGCEMDSMLRGLQCVEFDGANADDYSKFHEWGMNNGRSRFALPLGSRKVVLLYAILLRLVRCVHRSSYPDLTKIGTRFTGRPLDFVPRP